MRFMRFCPRGPRTIVGRTIMILLIGIVVSHLVSIAIYSDDRRTALLTAGGRHVSERMAAAYLSLDQTNVQERPAFIRSLWEPMFTISWTKHSTLGVVEKGGWRIHMVRAAIEDYLPDLKKDRIRISFHRRNDMRQHMDRMMSGESDHMHQGFSRFSRQWRDDSVLSVSLQLTDGSWFNVATPATRLRSPWLPRVFGPMVLTAIVILLLSVWAMRRSAKPIALFAQAAERLGRDVNAPPMPETGPREVVSASKAFNDMQRKLQSFIRDRTQMLAAISHDLRTPITRLRLRAELIDDAEQQKKMLADLDQMEQMIAATLAFARDETVDEASIRFDMAAMLQSLVDDITDTNGQASYTGPDKLDCVGRPGALQRVFQNLADNALKYGGRSDVTLQENNGALLITVEDDGPGIPQNERIRVFDPFYRVDPSRNRDTGGVGLGLAVARSVVRAHGGDISFKDGGERFGVVVRLSR